MLYSPDGSKGFSENQPDIHIVPSKMDHRLGGKNYLPTPAFADSDKMIISPVPRTVVKTTLSSILTCDTPTICLIAISIAILSAFGLLRHHLSKDVQIRNYFAEYFRFVWELYALFYSEGFRSLASKTTLSDKFAYGGWLVAATIILFMIGSDLKSEFSVDDYETVDYVEDLERYRHIQLYVMKLFKEYEDLRYEAKTNPKIKYIVDSIEANDAALEIEDIIGDKGESLVYSWINGARNGGKALLADNLYLILIGSIVFNDPDIPYFNWYFSKPLKESLYVLLRKRNLHPIILEKLSLFAMRHLECKPIYYFNSINRMKINDRIWHKPTQDYEDMTIDKFYSLSYVMLVGYLFALIVLIIEKIVAKCFGQKK